MDQPNYLIINPLQIVLFIEEEEEEEEEEDEEISEIDKKFIEKIKWLKNINDNLKRIKIKKILMDV